MTLAISVFLAVVLLVAGLIHLFLYRGLVRGLGITSPGLLWSLRVAAVLLAVSYPVTRWLDGFAPNGVVVVAHWISSVWIGLMFHLFWAGVVLWFVKVALRLGGAWARLEPYHVVLGRSAVAATVVTALVLGAIGVVGAYRPARIRHATVPVKGITDELRGLRIVLVADFHAGVLMGRAQVERRVAEIAALEPDLVLVPGDILDHPPERIHEIAEAYAKLRPPLGVFASTGNHEYIVGVKRSVAFLEQAGMKVLSGDRVELENGLVLAGVEDASAPRFGYPVTPVGEALGPAVKEKPTILLSHTPGSPTAADAIAAGADLVVSGHTHGGQIWPFTLLVRARYDHPHGLYEVGAGRQLTTCGIGFWGPPMRLGAPPEIWLISLTGE